MTQRILILGSSGYGKGVDAYAWHPAPGVPAGINVADYDAVIIDYTPFEDETVCRATLIRNFPMPADFARLIYHGGEVYVIGRPPSRIGSGAQETQGEWWSPVTMRVVERSGETIIAVAKEWEPWFDQHKRFTWHFDGFAFRADASSLATEAYALNVVLGADSSDLAKTKWKRPLGVELTLSAASGNLLVGKSGKIVWLPRPSQLSGRDAIALLLKQVYAIGTETPPPAWTGDYVIPNAQAAFVEVQACLKATEQAHMKLDEAEANAAPKMKLGRLLYARDDELEDVARLALQELDADVSLPEKAGVEDGRLIDPVGGREGILEIKSRNGPLKIDDVRQIINWMAEAGESEADGYLGKGIIIAAADLGGDKPPNQRQNIIGPNALDLATKQDICIVTSTQIYEAIRLKQLDELDLNSFWNTVMSASGLVSLPDVARPATAMA